jgi:protein phosphatase
MKPEVDVEIRPETMELFSGDVLMQSSDGLTDLALGRDILGATRQALASGGVEHACQMLVKMANDRGGHDNITVQMVRVAEVSAKTGQTIPERPAGQPHDVAAHAAPGPTPDMSPMSAPGPTPAMTPQPGAASPNGPPSLGRAAGSVPLETMHMSSPMAMGNPSYLGNKSLAQVAAAAGAPPGQGWAPQQPELPPPSLAQAAPAFGPPPGASPTLSEQQAPQSQAWGAPPPVAPGSPPQNLAPYRADGPNALPLPPASIRPLTPSPGPYGGGVPPTGPMLMPGPPPTVPMQVPVPGSPNAMASAGFGAPAPTPGAIPGPIAAPSRGGLVFLIIGFSAVIAVLIVVILILALK